VKKMKVAVYVIVVVAALLLLAALAFFILYGSLPAAPPRVLEGESRLRVVEFDPEGLTIKNEDGSWYVCKKFELRVSEEEGGVKSLLIRGTFPKSLRREPDGRLVQSDTEELLYGAHAYAVALDGSFARRKVDEGVWERARRLGPDELDTEYTSSDRRLFNSQGGTPTKGGLPLKSLAVGGAESGGWLLSRDGRYVAGFSHTSRRRPFKRPSLIPFLGEDDRIADGTMYVDIFDGATGERRARASKGHRGSYDMYVFRQATWFGGRYFAMPLDHAFGSWLVGVMPE
jgi:hypothetical protein